MIFQLPVCRFFGFSFRVPKTQAQPGVCVMSSQSHAHSSFDAWVCPPARASVTRDVCVSECACTLRSAAHEMQIDDDCQGFSCGFDKLPAFSSSSLFEMLVNSNVLATLLPRHRMGVFTECVSGCVCAWVDLWSTLVGIVSRFRLRHQFLMLWP